MRVKYMQTLNPLYAFEVDDIRIYDTATGAKIILHRDYLWEIDEAHGKEYIICNAQNLIEITE